MSFTSLYFLVSCAAFFFIYWRLDHRKQNIFLLVGSYVFYASWDWRFLFLILIPSCIDYFLAIKISNAESKRKKTAILWAALLVDLTVLFFFKYYNFFIDNLGALLGKMGIVEVSRWHLNIILPVGISYYLFKSMSYTIDIYRKVIKEPERDFWSYALYLSFFPQILAGPIERATNFLPQVSRPRTFNKKEFNESCYLIFWGLFKKVFIADNLFPIVNAIFTKGGVDSGFEILMGAYAAAFWFYADFSGYSDIAIGLAGCLGFKTMLNFDLPFFAKNPSEIWRRWHISLSSWCRDYIFYYLNRAKIKLTGIKGKGTSIAIIVTMAIMGLWHGSAWPFVLWGVYHGVLLALQNLIRPLVKNKVRVHPVVDFCKILFTFHLFVFGELIFCSKSISQMKDFVYSLFVDFKLTEYGLTLLGVIVFYTWILVALEIVQYLKRDYFVLLRWNPWIKSLVYFVFLVLIVVSGVDNGKEFVYIRF